MPLVLFLYLVLLVEMVCGFLMTKKFTLAPSHKKNKDFRTTDKYLLLHTLC